ncbi:MAG: aldehyde ferredoxin oxidoreductase family protein [Planctomycetota bacterium]|nr:aldehyde ferredoxin oxidoreductase family protein [Planctomycetota bacterium]MDI6786936.1 aldehyde ferredoxin oxidoreductase family protein [Planctomycetota bacterium]
MFAYGGKILRVNLSNDKISIEPLPEKLVSDYIGGRGFSARILYDELKTGIDPLGAENKIVVASGPLSGLFVPGAGKLTFASKSPATNSYGDSNIGGHLASEIKYAGYDVIIIEGISDKPVYLYINNDKIEIRDAGKYCGKGAITTEEMLKRDLGKEFEIAVIGPAGENKVKFACISHDFGRQAGRTGIGAVMGAKNLKAIAVRGTLSLKVADPDKLLEIGKKAFADCIKHPAWKLWLDQGTASVTNWSNQQGSFPTRNFQSGFFEDYQKISGDVMLKETIVNNKACFGCPMACGKYARTRRNNKEYYVEGPEYETAAMIGGDCAIGNIHDLTYANYICDELGIDTISGGSVAAFAMECYEKGIIDKKDTGGVELKFGDIRAFEHIMNLISRREGIGNLLADGVKVAAEKLGKGSARFAMHVKGLEISGYESRRAPAMLLSYMTCDIGAHHNRAWAITHDIAVGRDVFAGKSKRVIELQHIRPIFDMLGTCRLQWVELELSLDYYPQLINVTTGRNYTMDELLHSSERVWNLNRLFLIREHKDNFGRHFDYPPARVYENGVQTGPTAGSKVKKEDIDKLLDEYYQMRGWDKNGRPTPEKLKELGL